MKSTTTQKNPNLLKEQQFTGIVAGIDEVGRGSWAGPVVAASVAFHSYNLPKKFTEHIHDSKLLTATRRQEVYDSLTSSELCSYAIGQASVEEIDSLNIREATFLAMKRSFDLLSIQPQVALIDGNACPALPCQTVPIIQGDKISLSIAAASIIAKVYRDRLMTELAETYDQYGWDTNAGYGTRKHQQALLEHGITPLHRRSFAPIKELILAA